MLNKIQKILIVSIFSLVCTINYIYAYEDRDYYYFQYNIITSVDNRASVTTRSYNSTTEVTTVAKSELSLDPLKVFYNTSVVFGKHWVSGWSLEMEWTSLDVYFTDIDGRKVRNSDQARALVKVDYSMFNFRKDLFSLWSVVFFTKFGTGIVFVNQPGQNSGTGGNKIEPGFQFAVGGYYPVNKYLDLELHTNYFRNFSAMKEISSTGVEYKNQVALFNLFMGARFKL